MDFKEAQKHFKLTPGIHTASTYIEALETQLEKARALILCIYRAADRDWKIRASKFLKDPGGE